MFSACFSAPPRLRVKQHLANSTRSRPRRNSRPAEREVRRNLILGPCLPSPCQHRNAPDQLRYPPHAALVSLPPQREPRCEAVRSPLSPRSQVLTFLRSLSSPEANPEKMFSACFSAPPRLRVKQHLSNSTRSRPRRNIVCQSPIGRSSVIGIGAAVTRRPLPHHRAYGSVHGGSRRLR